MEQQRTHQNNWNTRGEWWSKSIEMLIACNITKITVGRVPSLAQHNTWRNVNKSSIQEKEEDEIQSRWPWWSRVRGENSWKLMIKSLLNIVNSRRA
jgi:hypothetical protein